MIMETSMMATTLRCAGFVTAALLASSASAQGLDWRVTPFLWGLGIDGDIGLGPVSRPVDVEFSDVLNVLHGAALLHVEAQSGEQSTALQQRDQRSHAHGIPRRTIVPR